MYINIENIHYMYICAYKLIIREILVTLVTKVAITLANTSLESVTNVCYKIKGVIMDKYKIITEKALEENRKRIIESNKQKTINRLKKIIYARS